MAKAKKAVSAKPARRASQRERERGVDLKLGYGGNLRPMMIEQSLTEEGRHITVYAGTRGEFLAAGIPSHLVAGDSPVEFEIRHLGERGPLGATMTVTGVDRWELEVDWRDEIPYDEGHPAICELARMMLIDLGYWYRNPDMKDDLEHPIRELIADDRATDFKRHNKAGLPKLQISSNFHKHLSQIARQVYGQVHRYGEVFPVQIVTKRTDQKRNSMRLVVDNTTAE